MRDTFARGDSNSNKNSIECTVVNISKAVLRNKLYSTACGCIHKVLIM